MKRGAGQAAVAARFEAAMLIVWSHIDRSE
jgi:hypothetical protein